jgi:hypothetical protein
VIPVRDGASDLGRCLRGLRDSSWADYELIVVDDGSADDSAAVATAAGARVLRHGRPLGPAAARNAGVEAARADLVFFLDADVVPHRETLARALAHFGRHPELSALFGSYDREPAARGVVSQFRNLLHHFVHQEGTFDGEMRPAHTFWTGCGAIRRDVFRALHGFDPTLYRRPAIEDIELGYRLTRAGHPIALARDVLATHLKRWTLASMVRTDIFQRGVPWTLLLLRSGVAESDLNVRPDQRLCVLANAVGLAGLLLAPAVPAALLLTLLNLLVLAAVNRRFYGFLRRLRGPGFVVPAFALHYLYFCCCGVSVAIALGLHARARRRERAASPKAPPGMRVDRAGAEAASRVPARRRRLPSRRG